MSTDNAIEQERLAAIQFAMNQLDDGMQACWAKVAAVDFHVHGTMAFAIDVDDSGRTARASRQPGETTGSAPLGTCMTDVLTGFRWAPPLFGQRLQLPFEFKAPSSQNIVDRDLVPAAAGPDASVRVLLDVQNTGNDQFSLLEVVTSRSHLDGMAKLGRGERWLSIHDAADRALVLRVPGGVEVAARIGSLLPDVRAPTCPTCTIAKVQADVLEVPAGVALPLHAHDGQTEVLYVIAGAGVLTVGNTTVAFGPTSVIQVPAGVTHALRADVALRAYRFMVPTAP